MNCNTQTLSAFGGTAAGFESHQLVFPEVALNFDGLEASKSTLCEEGFHKEAPRRAGNNGFLELA